MWTDKALQPHKVYEENSANDYTEMYFMTQYILAYTTLVWAFRVLSHRIHF